MNTESNNNAETSKSIFAVWYIKCTDLSENNHYPAYPIEESLCGIADSKESAESIMREYQSRFDMPIGIGYRIDEYPFNRCCCDNAKNTFSYDSATEQLDENSFSVGDPVEVLGRRTARLGVITEISFDDFGTLYYVCSEKTSKKSTFCRLEALRKPNFSISQKDYSAFDAMFRTGLTWKRCMDANIERGVSILDKCSKRFGKDGVTIIPESGKYFQPRIIMRIPYSPEPGWTTVISTDLEKILKDRRKTNVTLRTILRLPTNGRRYPYKKAVLSYKSEVQYSI